MLNPDDATIRQILTNPGTVAVVGWSPNPARPSHGVAAFLGAHGWRGFPVNPGQAGTPYGTDKVYASVRDIPTDAGVTMVDVFRQSDAVPALVDEAIEALPDLKVVWMQLGVTHEVAADKARAKGITVVQDRCPVIEMRRLGI